MGRQLSLEKQIKVLLWAVVGTVLMMFFALVIMQRVKRWAIIQYKRQIIEQSAGEIERLNGLGLGADSELIGLLENRKQRHANQLAAVEQSWFIPNSRSVLVKNQKHLALALRVNQKMIYSYLRDIYYFKPVANQSLFARQQLVQLLTDRSQLRRHYEVIQAASQGDLNAVKNMLSTKQKQIDEYIVQYASADGDVACLHGLCRSVKERDAVDRLLED